LETASSANTSTRDDPGRIETLRLAYEDRVREASRLRDARRAFTAQLGFLPASAIVAVGLFGAASNKVDGQWLALALIPFVFALAVGAYFSRLDPYRTIRDDIEGEMKTDWLRLSPEQWLVAKIELEERIYPRLVESVDRERRGVRAVQLLVAVQLVYVIVLVAFLN
jgi:hypothetical protein